MIPLGTSDPDRPVSGWRRLARAVPILTWLPGYERANLRGDVTAGITVGAMLVPQAMAYALLAGLPPEVGLYAATVPVVAYAAFGTSRQLSVGPFALVSLLTASALAGLVEEGSVAYLEAAALLALMIGLVHIVMGLGRLGYLVNFLSRSVLVGFTGAAALIIAFSQVKHILGVQTARSDSFIDTVRELFDHLSETHGPTLAFGLGALAVLFSVKRLAPRAPASLLIVIGSIIVSELFDLQGHGVAVVGAIPSSLPSFGVPELSGSLIGNLAASSLVITLVGFMGSIALAKTYAQRHRYEVDPNQELLGLGMANLAAGVFGGLPVSGGMSRSAVNENAGARTQVASIVTAAVVLVTIVALTPLLSALPNAALGAIIVMAIVGLIDIAEMREIARVKRTDLIGLVVAFVATLLFGMEIGIGLAVVASMLVVFARISMPHSAVLGHVEDTTSYRNVDRFPEVTTYAGVRIVRVDAALSFANATYVKKLLLSQVARLHGDPKYLVLDASGINDIDATGAAMLRDLLAELTDAGVMLHVADAKGPVRDVLRQAGLWEQLGERLHTSTHDAIGVILGQRPAPANQRLLGIDERYGAPLQGPAPEVDVSDQPEGNLS